MKVGTLDHIGVFIESLLEEQKQCIVFCILRVGNVIA